jgi:hypothetical protein
VDFVDFEDFVRLGTTSESVSNLTLR